MVTAKAAGKLILSGEHAVVYGRPALAIAINRYITTHLAENDQGLIKVSSNALADFSLPINDLLPLQTRLQKRYRAFEQGQLPIEAVLENPSQLMLYTLACVLRSQGKELHSGLDIHMETELAIGCGLGSSAAAILSLIKACEQFFKIKQFAPDRLSFARAIENLQHGQSSSLDLQVSLNGGGILMQQGEINKRTIANFNFFVVNTGVPQASTGQCVSQVASKLANNQALLNQFAHTTLAIDNALKATEMQTLTPLIPLIQQNHRLLVEIGVVPKKIQAFIAEIEKIGGGAKICGAGSVRGESAGYAFILAPEQPLQALCQRYRFQLETLSLSPATTKSLRPASSAA